MAFKKSKKKQQQRRQQKNKKSFIDLELQSICDDKWNNSAYAFKRALISFLIHSFMCIKLLCYSICIYGGVENCCPY